jgi:hypothetical protein
MAVEAMVFQSVATFAAPRGTVTGRKVAKNSRLISSRFMVGSSNFSGAP